MNVKRLLQLHARNAKIPYAQVLMHSPWNASSTACHYLGMRISFS